MTDLNEILAARVTTETFTYAEVQAIIADKNAIQNELNETKKKLEQEIKYKDVYCKQSSEHQNTIDQVHDVLTALDIPERKDGEDYRYSKFPLITRVAFLACKVTK